ncbi:MAG TPA: glycosyltransferase [Spirochaetales bacterium]|nr:glycosyltransferase [Spirochaetales bacterium]HPS15439.1 glycosyltransferase [Spirochaetales bacterium]
MNDLKGALITGVFNDSYAPITDGVAMVTRQYALWLNRKAGPSCVVTVDSPNYYDTEEFPVYRIPSVAFAARPPYRAGITVTGALKEKRLRGGILKEKLTIDVFDIPFDIVHSHCPFASGVLAQNIARRRNIPLVTTFHTKYRPEFEHALKVKPLVAIAMQYVRDYYKRADFVWVPNNETISILRDYGYSGDIEVMPNGTDLSVDISEIPILRKEGGVLLNVPDDSFVFVYVGQHIPEKNVDLIIDALNLLNQKGIPFKMVFIGDGRYRGAMEQKVGQFGLSRNVEFRGIVRDREFIKRAYARADLLLFPSLYDTSSLTIKEAAALQLPAVVIRDSPTAEGIVDGENGFLSNNDERDYADTIVRAMQNNPLRRAVGQNARNTLYSSWESVIDTVQNRYVEIVRSWHGR